MQDRLSSHSQASSHHSHHNTANFVPGISRAEISEAIELTKSVKQCHTWRELESLFEKASPSNTPTPCTSILNPIHVSAFMAALKRLVPTTLRNLPSGEPSDPSSLGSGGDPLRPKRGGQGMRVARERREIASFISLLLSSTIHLIPSFGPVELSSVFYALARLKITPPTPWLKATIKFSYQKMVEMKNGDSDYFSADDLGTLLASLAVIGINPGSIWTQLLCDLSEDYLVGVEAFRIKVHEANYQYYNCRGMVEVEVDRPLDPQRWAVGQGQDDEDDMDDISRALFSSVAISRLAWALAKFQHPVSSSWSSAYLNEVMTRCMGRHHVYKQESSSSSSSSGKKINPRDQMTSHHLANHIWAIVNLGLSPSPQWLDAVSSFSESWLSRSLVRNYQDQRWRELAGDGGESIGGSLLSWEVSILLWGLYTLGQDPHKGSWVKQATLLSLQTMTDAEPEHLSRVLWTVASISVSAPISTANAPQASSSFSSSSPSSSGGRSLLPSSWIPRFIQQSSLQIFSLKGQNLSTSLWSLAKLKVRPPDTWLEGITMAAFEQEFSSFGPNEVQNMIWALSKFRYYPDDAWVDLFWSHSYSVMKAMDPQHHVTVIRSLAELRLQPPNRWMFDFVKSCIPLMSEFGTEGHSQLLWSFAMLLSPPGPKFIDAFFKSSLAYLDEVETRKPPRGRRKILSVKDAEEGAEGGVTEGGSASSSSSSSSDKVSFDSLPGFAKSSSSRFGLDAGVIIMRTVSSLAKIGVTSPPVLWSSRLLNRSLETLDSFTIFNLAGLIYGLRVMEVAPPKRWVKKFVASVDTKLPSFISTMVSPASSAGLATDSSDDNKRPPRDLKAEKREDALGSLIWGIEPYDQEANGRWKQSLPHIVAPRYND